MRTYFLIVFVMAFATLMSGCAGRVLSPNENAFLETIQGGHVNYSDINVHKSKMLGLNRAKQEGVFNDANLALGKNVSDSDIEELILAQSEAFVLFNDVYVNRNDYRENLLEDWPIGYNLTVAALFAHEITHVWQWQHRGLTGYTPLKALLEHFQYNDPYSYIIEPGKKFLEYRYEQQGAMVQRYVFLSYNPVGNETEFSELGKLIRSVWPTLDVHKRSKNTEKQ